MLIHSLEVKYTNNTAEAKVSESIYNAIKDSELSSVFDIKLDGAKVKFTSKVTGEGGAAITDVKTTAANSNVKEGTRADGVNAKVQTNGANKAIAAGDKFTLNGKTYEFVSDANAKISEGAVGVIVGANENATLSNLNSAGIKAEYDTNDIVFSATKNGAALTLQIGDTSEDFNQMNVSVGDMHTAALGIADIDISTQAGAKAAVDKIKSAINSVSSTRGDLGAIQNRLEHTINNLSVTSENMTAAESRIRDVDMANEMMAYTKNNILVQSSQAMLAQANQIPQGVLQLLQ